ncbi:MAG: SDR family NAD(P)-dependent oxidoreductase [Desulfatiglans sp.]|jgi:3-oxoacyl-[acyl-carrier protein] reductase|nr:SDR family NAD(P)-dependent oxidoreductase [Thermodesulfobacteriota bacterium]MEE4353349.1 SDR family NAD(P)-dependent oxidoreductase [Desulfatiglans sp.]
MRLEGKVAIVTASAGAGIGKAAVWAMAKEGANVVVTDMHEKRIKSVAEDIKSQTGRDTLSVLCDVSEKDQVDHLVGETLKRFGRIDILVNNAGREVLAQIKDMTDEQWNTVIDVCLKGTFYTCRAVLPKMIEQKSGSIINISSIAGWIGTNDGEAHYCAAKAGVMAFTKCLAKEVARYGIRANTIAPGLIMNEFLRRIYPQEFFEKAKEMIPLGREGEPQDIANAILFLASSESSYMTGETMCLSGGMYMK